MLYGESSAGKTFLAIHTSLCVAWGVPFFGRKTKRGGVLYIAAEGGSSVLPRIESAEKALGIAADNLTGPCDPSICRAPIRIVTEAPNLSRDGDPMRLIQTIRKAAADFERQGSRLALVVVDTWHAALGGADENSAADAGHALKPLKDAVEEFRLCTLILHHPGKGAERGARGSSSLLAAVDTSIELHVPGCVGQGAKTADMTRRATVIKQRDGSVGDALHYRLRIVTIGNDEDGDPWTTCTVQWCEPPEDSTEGLRDNDRMLLEAVSASLADACGERAKLGTVRLRFFNSLGAGRTDDAQRQAWSRALKAARKAGRVAIGNDDEIWIPSPIEQA
ncbi:helicase RepA family protein [Sphingomonas sp. RB56-2]|uniref:Helicase RepA family protein n=2 Tax=Sphingomonas brevis TaxID=2908206 RepID=A0ABT0SAY6_9SPHN|nr:helicase RepA family protein [Sphingomonas brevis]